MTALDTSVSIPAMLSWHEHHAVCRDVAEGAVIPAHALLETYSVMTRLPTPHRIAGATVWRLLAGRFGTDQVLTASASLQRAVVDRLAVLGIEGGAVYDGLIALTAEQHGETLLTRDLRAARTYQLLGVDHRMVEPSAT